MIIMESRRGIRRIVLDVLKLHVPNIVELAVMIEEIDEVEGVNVSLVEIDSKTENIKLVIEGKDLRYPKILKKLESLRAAVHSIDQVVVGQKFVETVETPQD